MNSRRYWKNRLPFLLTNLVCMAALTVFLLVCGNSVSAVLLILIVWALVLLTGLILTYWKRKRQMKKLLDMAEQLSERYLISEVMELPEQAEDQVYYQLLKMAGKSMLEQIGEVERERLEYKEYIEPVSYTHLDVYKRQLQKNWPISSTRTLRTERLFGMSIHRRTRMRSGRLFSACWKIRC